MRTISAQHIAISAPTQLDIGRDLAMGVMQYCRQHPPLRAHLLPQAEPSLDLKKKLPPMLGVVGHFPPSDEEVRKLAQLHPNMVNTSNRRVVTDYARVGNDDHEVGRLAFSELNQQKLGKLIYYPFPNANFSLERGEGYREAARAAGVTVEEIGPLEAAAMRNLLINCDNREVTGLFAASDLGCRKLLQMVPELQNRIPHDFRLLGVDNESLIHGMLPISLSSIRLNFRQIGFLAAKLIHDYYPQPVPDEIQVKVPPLGVVRRFSTDLTACQDPLVRKALKIIKHDIRSIQNVTDLVKRVGASRRNLEVKFRKNLNLSVGGALSRQRIENAKTLLENTSFTIAEIADQCGINEYRIFSALFKRLTGETPKAFRNRARGCL